MIVVIETTFLYALICFSINSSVRTRSVLDQYVLEYYVRTTFPIRQLLFDLYCILHNTCISITTCILHNTCIRNTVLHTCNTCISITILHNTCISITILHNTCISNTVLHNTCTCTHVHCVYVQYNNKWYITIPITVVP